MDPHSAPKHPAEADDRSARDFDSGVAGASAQREYDRRKTKRENRVKNRLGRRFGGLILAIRDEPQSELAWARGAEGERELAEILSQIAGIRLLNDRRVPGTPGNIDHIVVAPTGVFVVDAKLYHGRIHIRDVGGFFKVDKRLYVGRRDCSDRAKNMSWQVEAVERALQESSITPMPPITPVLCFVRGEWPFLRAPNSYAGVRIEGEHSIQDLVARKGPLDEATIDRLALILARALPSK